MAFIRTAGSHVTAVPGERATRTRQDVSGILWTEYPTGVTAPARRGQSDPLASTQRKAMQLADITGDAEITMTRGDHFAPIHTTARSWSVQPASHLRHATRHEARAAYAERGWVVTVTEPDGVVGYRHTYHYSRTWPAVLAFLAEHFPGDPVTVTDLF